jgi:hypothetical protein
MSRKSDMRPKFLSFGHTYVHLENEPVPVARNMLQHFVARRGGDCNPGRGTAPCQSKRSRAACPISRYLRLASLRIEQPRAKLSKPASSFTKGISIIGFVPQFFGSTLQYLQGTMECPDAGMLALHGLLKKNLPAILRELARLRPELGSAELV